MSSPSPALLRRQNRTDSVILTFLDPRLLDEEKIRALGDELMQAATQAGDKLLVIDMQHVEYLSSHMVAKLLAVQQRLQSQAGSMVLTNVQPRIYATLQTANLDKVFDVRPFSKDKRHRIAPLDADDSGATMPLE